MIDHEHDDEGNCIIPAPSLPNWRWSSWDLAGISLTTVGGLFSVIGQGLNLLARECVAMANWSRDNRDARAAYEEQEQARWEMAAAYQGLVFGDDEDQS